MRGSWVQFPQEAFIFIFSHFETVQPPSDDKNKHISIIDIKVFSYTAIY